MGKSHANSVGESTNVGTLGYLVRIVGVVHVGTHTPCHLSTLKNLCQRAQQPS